MKKALSFLAIFFSLSALFSVAVSFDVTFPSEIKSVIENAINRNTEGRLDSHGLVFKAESYEENWDEFPGKLLVSFKLVPEINNNPILRTSFSTTVSKSENDIILHDNQDSSEKSEELVNGGNSEFELGLFVNSFEDVQGEGNLSEIISQEEAEPDFSEDTISEGSPTPDNVEGIFTEDKSKADEMITYYIRALVSNKKQLKKELEIEIERALYFDELTSNINPEFYIIDGTYVYHMDSDDGLVRGQMLKAVDQTGKKRGLFVLGSKVDEIAFLSPVYINNVLPGLSLKKASNFRYLLKGGVAFNPVSYYFGLDVSYTKYTYPFTPTIGFALERNGGDTNLYLSAGAEAFLSLNTLFPKVRFTLIENGRIGAGANFLVGINLNGVFQTDSTFSVFYEHSPVYSFFWRVGYSLMPGNKDGISFGIGGIF